MHDFPAVQFENGSAKSWPVPSLDAIWGARHPVCNHDRYKIPMDWNQHTHIMETVFQNVAGEEGSKTIKYFMNGIDESHSIHKPEDRFN